MLRLKDIKKKYPNAKKWTLKNINITFPRTGLIVILGESGSGKSTLLNIIGGLDEATSGSMILDGKDITHMNTRQLNNYHNASVGFIFQQYNLINSLNVEENILANGDMEQTKKYMRQLNIIQLKNKKINTLSGGQMQRVAIARALVANPKILLCDEPTGALDKETGKIILNLLKHLSRKKLVILITHNEEEAQIYADHIIRLKDGKIISNTLSEEEKKGVLEEARVVKNSKKKQQIIRIIKSNMKSKIKRNILTIVSFSIGLISLLLVLSINNGFTDSIEIYEKNSLGRYPLYISKYSTNLEQDLNSLFENKEKDTEESIIKATKQVQENNITQDYLKYMEECQQHILYKEYTYIIENKKIRTYEDTEEFRKEIDILYGDYGTKNNEVLLLVDKLETIDEKLLLSIGLKKEQYKFDELIGYTYTMQNKKYKIVGIVKGKKESIYSDLSAILYPQNSIKKQIPEEIYIYPKSFQDKEQIKKHLNQYHDKINYTDYASTFKNISKTLMDGLSIILICFSIISLIVATIMIGVLNYISVIERIHDIGILKSLGYSNQNIKYIFYIENIIIAIISSLLSILVVLILSVTLNQLLYNFTGLTNILKLSLLSLTITFLLSMFLSIIACSIPIRSIKKMKIINTIRYD